VHHIVQPANIDLHETRSGSALNSAHLFGPQLRYQSRTKLQTRQTQMPISNDLRICRSLDEEREFGTGSSSPRDEHTYSDRMSAWVKRVSPWSIKRLLTLGVFVTLLG
jgi:hypothetical protein